MIHDKRMKLIKSENEINYYLFRPPVFSCYYNCETSKHTVVPFYRHTLTRKLHMR